MTFPELSDGEIESLSRILGEAGSGSEISKYLERSGLVDDSGQSTKWRRLDAVFHASQRQAKCSNGIMGFVAKFLEPARFVGNSDTFEGVRSSVNAVLSLKGIEYGPDGQFRACKPAASITEAEVRANELRAKLRARGIHSEVIRYCRAELIARDTFHAVFEAVKGLFERIRELSELTDDGALLIDKAFNVDRPILAFNSLQTESERSEHKGVATLLKGCHMAIRNPLAHGPRLLWNGEGDVLDSLTLLSLLHRKLDGAIRVRMVP